MGVSKPNTKWNKESHEKFLKEYERIFGKKKKKEAEEDD